MQTAAGAGVLSLSVACPALLVIDMLAIALMLVIISEPNMILDFRGYNDSNGLLITLGTIAMLHCCNAMTCKAYCGCLSPSFTSQFIRRVAA